MASGRVLVVDDEIYIVHILDFSLGMEGYEVVTALDGEQAVAQAKATKPDVIIMDTLMPRMDGLDACRALKASDETKDIPVVILSPRTRSVDQQMAFEAGAEEVMTKPFSPRKLVERVTAILATRRPAAS